MTNRDLTGAEQSLLEHLERLAFPEVTREAVSAFYKHGYRHTPASRGLDDWRKLAILVEEVGEVAKALTYDQDPANLRTELIQTATMALLWLVSIDYP